ncbi:MAG: hypothetical protein IJW54_07655 [Clostridia bacterium]|nr:hypothetical protein [Clostridia bacterium]
MNKFKETKKSVKEEISKRRLKRDENGRVVIEMTVKNDDDFLSPFSENETPVISESVSDFIENSTISLPLEPLTMKIHSDCIDEREQELYKKAIKEYYTERYISNEKEIKRNYIIAIIMALVGVLMLGFSIYFGVSEQMLVAEIIDISAWVFLWEAVDISILRNISLRVKRKRYLSYIGMNIEY